MRVRTVIAVCLVAACGGDAETPPPEGPVYCLEQADCPSGFACDTWTGLCVCASSGVCPDQQLCNPYTGLCEIQEGRCASNAACAPSEYCGADGQCARRLGLCEPCRSSNQCGSDQDLCLPSGACGLDCSGNLDACPPGSICWPFGQTAQCVPALGDCSVPPRCRADADCPPGNTCTEGSCQAACAEHSDCPAQWRCVDRLCRAPTSCNHEEANCPAGTSCQAGRCLPGCVNNSGCALGEICAEGRCETGCTNHSDCPLDRACQAGQCVDEVCTGNQCAPACQVDLFCGPGRHCDRRRAQCQEGLPGGLCQRCDQMVAGGCGNGLCVGVARREACTADRDCVADGTYCSNTYGCFQDRECPQNQSCVGANIPRNEAGQCSGGVCSNFHCATRCEPNDGNCPVGFVCEDVRRAGGGSVIGSFCQPEDGEFCP